MLITPASLRAINVGYKKTFQGVLSSTKPVWQSFATKVPSAGSSENYGFLNQWPSMREWLGDKIFKSITASAYSLPNKDWESSIEVDRNDIEDDRLGIYTPVFQEAGRAVAVFPDQLLFAALAAGGAELCYDGQYFFDTDHPENGTTVANVQSGGGNPWYLFDTSRALKPMMHQVRKEPQFISMDTTTDEAVFTAKKFRYSIESRGNAGYGLWQMAYKSSDDLDADNFNTAYNAIMARKSDEGKPLGLMPTMLLCGTSRRVEAEALLKAEKLSSGASNTNYKRVELLVTPYLA